ncbi:MAG: hypothetical protein A3H27_18075 [Acidobacteria bacterium RIFCSPLOWO2_02_FULL_59_13]|nr:MAG: hypothetical protein A3H27_18075 [Acidobacteria bacterium RIFCSPLOWO2_02_FULL_59_13]
MGGQIVVEGEPLKEGSTVTILFPEERSFQLNDADEEALLAAIAEADRGEALDADDVLSRLHNRR